MKLIPLTQGYFAQVDDEDYEQLIKLKWSVKIDYRKHGTVCYARHTKVQMGKRVSIYMHRLIMEITDSKIFTDHKNGDGLDNRKINLRKCTNRQNLYNTNAITGSKSQYKGISWSKEKRKWMSKMMINGKNKSIGSFDNELDAAICYDKIAIKIHGEFIKLNVKP